MERMKKRQVTAAAVGLLALFAGSEAWAQASSTTVSQTATRLDAATTGAIAGGIATNAQVTATVAAVASQYFYVTSIFTQSCEDSTGAAIPLVSWTTTNLPGNPVIVANAAAAASTCAAPTQLNFTTPLKALNPGTAVTLVSPTGISHVSFYGYVTGYYGF